VKISTVLGVVGGLLIVAKGLGIRSLDSMIFLIGGSNPPVTTIALVTIAGGMLGIIGAAIGFKVGGLVMIVAGLIGLIGLDIFSVVPFVLLILAAEMSLREKQLVFEEGEVQERPSYRQERRRSHIVRNITAFVVVLIVFLLLGRVLLTELHIGGPPPVNLLITRATLDSATAPSSSDYYVYSVNVSYFGLGTAWPFDPTHFRLIYGQPPRSTYITPIGVPENRPIQSALLGNGQRATGQIAFEVPKGSVPTRIQYNDSFENLATIAPAVSSWFSMITGVQANITGVTNSTGFHVTASIENETQYYYNGNIISVRVSVVYNGSNTHSFSLVNPIIIHETGFAVSSVQPFVVPQPYPNARETVELINLITPEYSYGGFLHLTLTVTQ
jgi:hypothetical protein